MTGNSVESPSVILHRAAERAIRAPSIHNSQPWRFVLTDEALEIHTDNDRRLRVLDPRGRQMIISCGCALYNARVAVEASGYEPLVKRFPDPDRPEIVARVSVGSPGYWPGSGALDLAIDKRRTNRRSFAPDQVPGWLITELKIAARADDGILVPITRPEHRSAVEMLTSMADRIEQADVAYRAELASWTTDDPRRTDGVQAASIPYTHGLRRDRLPIRDFDVEGTGWLPPSSESDGNQCLVLLCSHDDDHRGWLRTGEALEHVWLKLTDRGFWASPLTQVIEVRETHRRLRAELRLAAQPQLLLRVGRAAFTAPTKRRPPHDVINDRRRAC